MSDREPFLTFRWGRSTTKWISWFVTDTRRWHPKRLTVWTRWFSFSVGHRFPKDDGWPQ